jgi:hypothetical protein
VSGDRSYWVAEVSYWHLSDMARVMRDVCS